MPLVEIARKMCPSCQKPNIRALAYCTGCGTSLEDAEISISNSCAFCDIISRTNEENKEAGEVIRYRDDQILIFDAKFSMCRFQWNVIPLQHIEDVQNLNESHVELLHHMYAKTCAVITKILGAEGHVFGDEGDPTNGIYFGYNYPPSVPHLHLYVVVCPVFPDYPSTSLFTYPRSIPHVEVMRNLIEKGKVLVGSERNDKENHEKIRSDMIKENSLRWEQLKQKGLDATAYKKQ